MGLAAFVLYALTTNAGWSPGRPATLAAQHLGVSPFAPMSNGLWGMMARAVAALPLDTAWALNLVSAIFGACSVGLLCDIMFRIPHDFTAEERRVKKWDVVARKVSGVFSASFLMVSSAFWVASTRVYTATFDVFLMLVLVRMLLAYWVRPRNTLLYTMALLYGLALSEFATLYIVFPVYGLFLIYIMWRSGNLNWKRVGISSALGLVGLSMYLHTAWRYSQTDSATWRGFGSFGSVLWFVFREHYHLIAKSLPRVGFLLMFVMVFLPFFILLLPRLFVQKNDTRPSYLIASVLIALTGVMLYNVPGTPWAMYKQHVFPFLVSPYVLCGAWGGYLAGYLVIIMRYFGGRASVARILARVSMLLLAGLIGVAAVRNYPDLKNQGPRHFRLVTSRVLDEMKGRTWLLAPGYFADTLLLEAWERNQKIVVLVPQMTVDVAYRRFLADQLADSRLKGLAEMSLEALLAEWPHRDPAIRDDIAVWNYPAIWPVMGLTPVPSGLLSIPASDADKDSNELLEELKTFYTKLIDVSVTVQDDILMNWVMNAASRNANELGVLLEDEENVDGAREAYQLSKRLNPENLSAMLNEVSLARREEAPDADALEKLLKEEVDKREEKLNTLVMDRQYGTVRNPRAYLSRGWMWVLSGRPQAVEDNVAHAEKMASLSDAFRNQLAHLYFTYELNDQSRALYEQALKKDPESPTALIGLARIAVRENQLAKARALLEQVPESRIDPDLLEVEFATLDVFEGRMDEAIDRLTAIIKRKPDNKAAWQSLATISLVVRDPALRKKTSEALKRLGKDNPLYLQLRGRLAMMDNNLKGARNLLERSLRLQPNNLQVLELLLQLDYREGFRSYADARVRSILRLDPGNPLANQFLASAQMVRGEYHLAEASLRAALERQRNFALLNDLAWALYKQGNYKEALVFVKESLSLFDKFGGAYDTFGMVLLELGREDESEKALERALELQPQDLEIAFHLAEVKARRGNTQGAIELLEQLEEKTDRMSPVLAEDVHGLLQDLR